MPWSQPRGLESGERDRVITVEQRVVTTDDAGFPIEVWSELVTLPASKTDVEVRERYFADKFGSAVDTRWQINYRADMDPELIDVAADRRVLFRGRRFDIIGAFHLGRRDGIELLTLAATKVA